MTYANCLTYLKCIEPLTAEETLVDLTVSCYPNQKKSTAQQIEKDLRSRTKRNLEGSHKQATTEDIYRDLIRKLGNG